MDFLKNIEDLAGVKIPLHVKNALIHTNYSNHISFPKLKKEDLNEIEDFVKKNIYKAIPENAKKEDYYGIFFQDDPLNFQFLPGESVLIIELVNLYIEKQLRHKKDTDAPNPKRIIVESTELHDIVNKQESTLLRMLIESARKRAESHGKNGNRYDHVLKLFSSYIFMVGGPILYDTLKENLPLPSRSQISRFIYDSRPIVEGEVRAEELKKELEERKLPLKVWISEDGTRCTGKVQYNPKTNELIGFVLPKDKNSMPIACSFQANSIEEIVKHHEENPLSTYLYVYMAQPLAEDSPAFCLTIFGTDNKFVAEDSLKRINYIIMCLEKQGIDAWGDSSDGDQRPLKVHRIQSELGLVAPDFSELRENLPRNFFPGFHAKVLPKIIPVQDPTHIAGTLRNRALKPSILLPIGKFVVSYAHSENLLDLFTRDKHCLTEKDFSPKDKMNFRSVLRFCDPLVQKLLHDNCPASEATQEYLKIMHYVIDSYLSKQLGILERLYRIWYSVYFLRYWRKWLSDNGYSLQDNFISLNSYLCIEINAHALLNIIFKCLKNEDFESFLPCFFGSQACESLFRQLRSMSTTYSTVVNCSVLEALHKLRRIQLQEYVSVHQFHTDGEKLFFPRNKHLHAHYDEKSKYSSGSNPPDVFFDSKIPVNIDTMHNALIKSKKDAHTAISKLGVKLDKKVADDLDVNEIDDLLVGDDVSDDDYHGVEEEEEEVEEEEDDDDDEDDNESDLEKNKKEDEGINEPMEVDGDFETRKMSQFLTRKRNDGEIEYVRKSTIVWQLNKTTNKLSSDRMVRVKESELMTQKKNLVLCNGKSDRIFVRDWCLFKRVDNDKSLVGYLLNFVYPDEKTWRKAEYSGKYANIEKNTKEIEVMCDWYAVNKDRSLKLVTSYTRGYVPISNYKFTLIPPVLENKKYLLSQETYSFVKSMI